MTRKPRKSRFNYKKRSAAAAKKRSADNNNTRDSYLKEGVKFYGAKKGDNTIRLLPPTWEDAENYGIDVFIHYGIGADNNSYLCLNKMKGEPCPICEERERALSDEKDEYAKSLRPTKRVLAYLIDRKEENEGVKVWAMPITLDKEINLQSVDPQTDEVLSVDDPDEGFDVFYQKTGEAQMTRYEGVRLARNPSEIDDEFLDYIEENPLENILNYHDYDHIDRVFNLSSAATRKTETSSEKSATESSEEQVEQTEQSEEQAEVTWASVHGMSADELDELCAAEDLKLDPDDFSDEEEYADAICEELDIQKPRKGRRSNAASSRLKTLGRKTA